MKALELARRAGISPSQVSKIETGKATLSVAALADIASALDRPLAYLFQSDRETPKSLGVVGSLATVEGPERQAFQWFVDEVGRLSAGRLTLLPVGGPGIASGARQITQLSEGVIDLFIEDIVEFSGLAPALQPLALPYVFDREDQRTAFFEGAFFRHNVIDRLAEADVRILNGRWNWRRGLEWVIASTRPLFDPSDLRGMTIRVGEAPGVAEFWDAMGATPVAIPWPRAKRALQRGEIQAMCTHRSHLGPLGLCRHAPYVTCLGDLCPIVVAAMNATRFRALPPDVQEAVTGACDAAGDVFSERVRGAEAENERLCTDRDGGSFITPPPGRWRDRVVAVRRGLIDDGVLLPEPWAEIARLTGG
jgi:TRAP-type C4-dicarboxylate transport system substrate-binding protein